MAPENLNLSVIRPGDLLVLRFQFENVEVTPPAAGQGGELGGTASARLTVHFQPQHITEQAFFQASQDHQNPVPSDQTPAAPGSVQSILAGESRLVFDVPAGETIPLTVAGVLEALERLPLRVSAINRWVPPGCLNPIGWLAQRPAVTPPGADITAIELPYRLVLSPDELATWSHASEPVVRGDWAELWHTRLGSSRRNNDPRLRAIWSPDFRADSLQPLHGPDPPPQPFLMSLEERDRNEIVHLTSNYRISGFLPEPLETDQFMLSSLGGWLEVEGVWNDRPQIAPDEQLIVENWRHEAKMGRDQYVRVIYAGYLFPFGHKASLVKITERKFLFKQDPPRHIAYLYQRLFIIVREPTKHYQARDLPFRTVTFKTKVTPNLVTNDDIAGLALSAFWPRVDVDGGPFDFQFHLRGIDWEGRTSEWTQPLVFVDDDNGVDNIDDVLNAYNSVLGVDHERRKRPFGGQTVSFAPAKKAKDTAFEAADVSFEGVKVDGGVRPPFRPAMKQANVDVPAVKDLLGKNVPSKVEWEPSFLATSSTIGNKGEVFLQLIQNEALEFATEKVGGMVAPNFDISGLSRGFGPVGGPIQDMVGGSFKPADIFGAVKLLGGITLGEIFKALDFDLPDTTGGKIPGLTSERVGNLIRTKYVWKIGASEMADNHGLFTPEPTSAFELEAVLDTPIDGSPPDFSIQGTLTAFKVTLLPGLELVGLGFESVTFKTVPNEKPDVAVEIGVVEFKDILEFVNELQNVIPLDGFSAGPAIDISPSPPGVNVGFTLGIPTLGIGIMTIQNISLTAGFFLPFGSEGLNFHFAFCERQQPFILTVSLFGGGGFFSIDIGLDGVKMIEAALEFGASAAINLGVASGEATMMAGFYFQMAGADFELTGYFRAYGSLSILGIITVSLEFYLGLTYATKGISPHGGTLWGQASLTVKIEILFFSMSVGVSMEREFAGSDPKFREMLTPGDWSDYAGAFAAYP